MSLVHPIALMAGAGLVALPLLVHLLTRPRPVRFPFSALRFLESALRQRRFFARVRDVLILGLRVLLLAAIAAAFARPLLQGAGAPAGKDVTRRVIVLDVSRSMNARKGGVRVFDRAQAQALRYVKRGGDLRTNVVLAGARPRAAFDTLSANYPALEAEVRRAQPLDKELDARSALARAAQLLEAKGRENVGRGQVVVVTDLQATNWRGVSRAALPSDLDVTVEYVGLGPDAGNLTLAGVSAPERVEVGRALRLRVDVQNSAGSEQVRTVEVAANGRVYRQDVRCAAWQSAAAFFDLPAPEAGWLTGTATIVEARDALPADDVPALRPRRRGGAHVRADQPRGSPPRRHVVLLPVADAMPVARAGRALRRQDRARAAGAPGNDSLRAGPPPGRQQARPFGLRGRRRPRRPPRAGPSGALRGRRPR